MAQIHSSSPLHDGRSGAGMKRQATWEALPDIDFFSIPVDDFFETYVSELGQRGLQQDGLPQAAPPINGAELDPVLEHFPHAGTQQMNGLMDPPLVAPLQAQQYSVEQQQPGALGAYAPVQEGGMPELPVADPLTAGTMGNVITSGFEAQEAHRRSASGSQGSGNWGAGLHKASPRAAGNGGGHGSGSGHMSNDDSPEDDGERSGSGKGGNAAKRGGAAGKDTKTKRNARQQDQNKQAQQRYRERRKQKFAEMEQSLAVLTTRVEELQDAQQAAAHAHAQAADLEDKLREKELEVERLRMALAKAGVDQSAVAGPEKMEYGPIKPAECEAYRAQKEKSRQEEIAHFQAEMAANKAELQSLVDAHGLTHANPSGAGVAQEVIDRVAELVDRGCRLCQNAMRAEGIKVLALMSCDVARMGHIQCHVEQAKWSRILDILRLSGEQKERLLDLRKLHLRNLRALYEDRQRLNLQAMSLMLPKNLPRRQLPDAATLESRMDCMRLTASYSAAALSNVQLDQILDDIKCNLRKEQRTVMELSWITVHKVLTPIQSGLFVVEAFPGHCDCLALANILAKAMGMNSADNQALEPCSSEEKSETCSLSHV